MPAADGRIISDENWKLHMAAAKEAGSGEHAEVFLFHAHSYGDTNQKEALQTWYADLKERYSGDARIGFGRLHGEPIGLHPQANFEMEFTRDMFAEIVTHIMFNRPDVLSVFIHPFTAQGYEDHTSRAVWLGKQLTLKVAMLKPFDSQMAEKVDAGEDPVDLMWAFRNKIAKNNAAKNWAK